MRRARDAAVFMHERAPIPFTVEDVVRFRTRDGREMHVTVRRWAAPAERTMLIWYSPDDPTRATIAGPASWAAGSLLALLSLAWLVWS